MYTHVSCFIPCLQLSPEPYAQNHAEFVSVQTVNALARNAQLAVGKMNTGGSLPEMLGVEPVGLEDALQRALVFEDEVISTFSSGWG